MNSLTAEQIACCTGCSILRAVIWLNPINDTLALFEIDTPARRAMFLAQVGHESDSLVFVKELWGPSTAQLGYEGRADLGNTQPGDGSLYRGRGLIQITGRANYAAAAMALDIDCLDNPKLLEAPEYAAAVSGWYWKSHGLNEIADKGDYLHCTKVINGGLIGYADRVARWNVAKNCLGVK